jgi:hypothetical protein
LYVCIDGNQGKSDMNIQNILLWQQKQFTVYVLKWSILCLFMFLIHSLLKYLGKKKYLNDRQYTCKVSLWFSIHARFRYGSLIYKSYIPFLYCHIKVFIHIFTSQIVKLNYTVLKTGCSGCLFLILFRIQIYISSLLVSESNCWSFYS